jgi:uncharacterized protein (TIGR03067 family)
MNARLALVGLVGALVIVPWGAAADTKDDAAAEMKKLEGTWRGRRMERLGTLTPDIVTKMMGVVIEDDTMQFLYGGNSKGAKGTFTVDPTKDPKEIEIEYTQGSEIGKKRLGIYKLTKDTLEIAWSELDGKKRPKKFTTRPGVGSGELYSVYKKEE